MPNWMKSVTSTPHRPDVAANEHVEDAADDERLPIGQPSSTLAILAAARFTVAMITMLKNRPR